MEKITDWVKLWDELVQRREHKYAAKRHEKDDYWKGQARVFSMRVDKRWRQPDATRTFLLDYFSQHPADSLLDIGAGAGNWELSFVHFFKKITAVEPSAGMREMMQENLQKAHISPQQVEIIDASWPDVDVPQHDYSFCSHACYGAKDLPRFIRHMEAATRKTCFMLIRAPLYSDLYTQIAQKVWGQPNDSTNFNIAYNIMLSMDIHPNVLFEARKPWHTKRFGSFEEALTDVKLRFNVEDDPQYDEYLRGMIRTHMKQDEQGLYFGQIMKAALVYWDPLHSAAE